MRCPRCAHTNPEGARFCNDCGARLEAATAPPGREPLDYTPRHLAESVLRDRSALEGERKQVTVLFADLKGSLELARHFDPEAWHRILDQFFEILTDGVHRFEGTINQYTGDGIMALFGAPIAREDHAQRACHAALRIRAAVIAYAEAFRERHGREFGVRMGINSGEVVVGRIGDDLRMDYTAQGHVVGVASRMEQIAPPGEIYLTQTVAELARGFFRLRSLGHREVAGVGEPIEVFALEGTGPARTRLDLADDRGLSPFVGREGVMATLQKALRSVHSGAGLVIGIEGEAGVGKSRLCVEFGARCRRRGVPFWEAHCPSHGSAIPHLAVRQLLRSLLGIDDAEPDETKRERVIAGLEGAEDPATVALLLDLLDLPNADLPPPPAASAEREDALARLLVRRIRERTQDRPAVLLVDDLHWIDPESEALLARLVDAVAELRLLLLVNFRPEHRVEWMESAVFRQLGLRPLNHESSQELLRALVGNDPSVARLAELVGETAAGNPFFMEELVRSLAEAGELEGECGAFVGTESEELEVPVTVRQVVAARIDRLAAADKRTLQIASVIGRGFERAVLARVADVAEEELAASLSALEAGGFVRRGWVYRPDQFGFGHSLIQEVAYRSVLAERRESLHRHVARALEDSEERLGERAALIAHHWEVGGAQRAAASWRRRAAFRVTNLVPKRRWEQRGSET